MTVSLSLYCRCAAFLPYIIREDNITITTLSLRVTESSYSSAARAINAAERRNQAGIANFTSQGASFPCINVIRGGTEPRGFLIKSTTPPLSHKFIIAPIYPRPFRAAEVGLYSHGMRP